MKNPKFKIGDIVVMRGELYKIENISKDGYSVSDVKPDDGIYLAYMYITGVKEEDLTTPINK